MPVGRRPYHRLQLPVSSLWRLALFAVLVNRLTSLASHPCLQFEGLPARMGANLIFAPSNGLRHYLKMQYADQTFKGLYHWNLFDAVVLLPYFAVMIVLALYGVHRYTMCYLYFKYRKNYNPNPPKHFEELPRVTVQLPIFNAVSL